MKTLLSLPPEMLCQIGDYIASEDRQFIFDYSLVSRQCLYAANHRRLEHVHFTIVSRQRLNHDIEQWSSMLQDAGAFSFVRHLDIEGRLSPRDDDKQSFTAAEEDISDDDEEILNVRSRYGRKFDSPFPLEEEVFNAWNPLARLLSRLSGLRDLTWACTNQFPPCLLHILHRELPRCRLHMKIFRLHSLCYDVDHPRDVDGYELSLASSPSLSSIVVPVHYYSHDGRVEYNFEAALRIAQGMAPNLKDVQISLVFLESSPALDRAVRRGRDPWRGFFVDRPSETGQVQQSHIRSIGLDQSASMRDWNFWKTHINFSGLRTMRLWYASQRMLENLRSADLASLRVLVLEMEPAQADHFAVHHFATLQDTAVKELLERLPPLEKLHLACDHISASWQPIMSRHGATLRTLSVIPRMPRTREVGISSQNIRDIGKHCPLVQDLRLRIVRSQGNAAEVEIYQALRTLTHIRDIALELDCLTAVHETLRVNSAITIPRNRLIEDYYSEESEVAFLINLALDEMLAREIFSQVAGLGGPLRQLKLDIVTTYQSIPHIWFSVMRVMRRRWKCLRRVGDSVRVEERGIGQREEMNTGVDLGDLEPAFRRIWPAKTGSWKDDWHSFPLELTKQTDARPCMV